MTRYSIVILLALNFLVSCVQKPAQTAQATEVQKYPKRLLFLVFDQLRPDLIDRFNMKTFQKIRNQGLHFPNAYVGHLGSITVVSHAVMTQGLFPKHLPWQDEVMKDDQKLLGKEASYYSMLDLKTQDYFSLLKPTRGTSLPVQLSEKDKPQAAIAQKFYAAHVFGGPDVNSVITLGEKRKEDPFKGWRAPVGVNVPGFALEPFGGKFFVDSRNAFGSENTLYPLDGHRYVPTSDSEHVGGDPWTAHMAVEFMKENKNWSAVYASFGAIDKVLHMLHEHDEDTKEPWAIKNGVTLAKTLERADESLAYLLDYLEKQNLLNDTLVVITADHGGQYDRFYHGINEPGKTVFEYGKGKNFEANHIIPSLKPVFDTNLVETATFDSMLRFYLNKKDMVSKAKFAKALKSAPGIAEIYVKQKTKNSIHYIRHYRSTDLAGEALEWAKEHNQELVETMATESSADILGLLQDGHGYALLGEHGGAQKQVQSIPAIFLSSNPSLRGKVSEAQVRLVDLEPMILKMMNKAIPEGLDGNSAAIDGLIQNGHE